MTPSYAEAMEWFTPARLKRFWAMVDRTTTPDGCWPWLGALTDSGHGRYEFDGKTARAHRLAWMLARGGDVPEWIKIRHFFCETKACCRVSHLVGGTLIDNNWDELLIHSAFRGEPQAVTVVAEMIEQEALIRYMQHPYVGYFSDSLGVSDPPLQ